jgi:Spy/CpxP family protein refolding chaperone
MNRRAVFLVVVVFVLGLALGGLSMHLAADRLWGGHPGKGKGRDGRPTVVQQLTMELGLTPEQQQQLSQILEESKTKYQAIYDQVRPQLQQVREAGRNRIRAILTPEQRPKFEERVRRMDEERRKRNGGR